MIENCESPYAASKLSNEAQVYSYNKCYDIDYIVFRFSNVYGMYDNSDRVVPLFIRLAKDNKDLEVYGKDKLLDFTYIDDLIEALVIYINKFNDLKNDTYNIASGIATSIESVAKIIKQELNSDSKIIISNNRPGEVIKFVADLTKLNKKITWKSNINIDEGIKKAIKYYINDGGKNGNESN